MLFDKSLMKKSKSVKSACGKKKSVKAAVDGGWEVPDHLAHEAYDLAEEYFGTEDINQQIVDALSDTELAENLAFIFRMNDFREWDDYLEENYPEDEDDEDDEDIEESVRAKRKRAIRASKKSVKRFKVNASTGKVSYKRRNRVTASNGNEIVDNLLYLTHNMWFEPMSKFSQTIYNADEIIPLIDFDECVEFGTLNGQTLLIYDMHGDRKHIKYSCSMTTMFDQIVLTDVWDENGQIYACDWDAIWDELAKKNNWNGEFDMDVEASIKRRKNKVTAAVDGGSVTLKGMNTDVIPVADFGCYWGSLRGALEDVFVYDALGDIEPDDEYYDEIMQLVEEKYDGVPEFFEQVLRYAPGTIQEAFNDYDIPGTVVNGSCKWYHPREYNFSDDVIEFDMTIDTNWVENKFRELSENSAFTKFIDREFSSRDGFISFMPNETSEYETLLDPNNGEYWKVVSAIIKFIVNEDPSIRDSVTEDLYESLRENADYTTFSSFDIY